MMEYSNETSCFLFSKARKMQINKYAKRKIIHAMLESKYG
jgi:hypothetical protein